MTPHAPALLFSYAYLRDKSKLVQTMYRARELGCHIMIDSGAFTAYRQGTTIALDDYCAFLAEHAGLGARAVQLDVIGEAAPSRANLDRMRDKGLDPMPVLIFTEAASTAADLVAHSTAGICVARGARLAMRRADEWAVNRCAHVRAAVGADCWIHALGFGPQAPMLIRSAINAGDTTSHILMTAYGGILLFDERTMVMHYIRCGANLNATTLMRPAVKRLCLLYGVTHRDLWSDRISLTSGAALRASSRSYIRMQSVIARQGKLLYAACANAWVATILLDAFQHEKEGSNAT